MKSSSAAMRLVGAHASGSFLCAARRFSGFATELRVSLSD